MGCGTGPIPIGGGCFALREKKKHGLLAACQLQLPTGLPTRRPPSDSGCDCWCPLQQQQRLGWAAGRVPEGLWIQPALQAWKFQWLGRPRSRLAQPGPAHSS